MNEPKKEPISQMIRIGIAKLDFQAVWILAAYAAATVYLFYAAATGKPTPWLAGALGLLALVQAFVTCLLQQTLVEVAEMLREAEAYILKHQ